MAMVNHSDDKFELPLLWRLCAVMVDFGYPVTVLDATTCESDVNPGLEQLLEYDFWRPNAHAEIPAWSVIPSAYGLQSLGAMQDRRAQSLQHLGQLFQHEGVIILYGKAQWLTPLLAHSGVKPLLAVAPLQSALLSSYAALKYLLLNGNLEPTIVSLVQSPEPLSKSKLKAIAVTLSDCARNFLGYDVNALNISAPADDDRLCADMQRLALRMLEDGVPLNKDTLVTAPYAQRNSPSHFTGAH